MRKIVIFMLLLYIFSNVSAEIEVLNEGFENGISAYWTQEYVEGEVNWQIHTGGQNDHPAAAYEGNFNAWFFDNTEEGYTTKLISPEFSITSNSKLTFWYCQDSWTSYQDYLRVYYRTSANDDWQLLEYFEEESIEWTQVILDLPEPTSSYSIAFEGEANWGYGVCLDAVRVADCVLNILVWDNDNNSDYNDPNTGVYHTCEYSITSNLESNNLDYDLVTVLPSNLDFYDLVMIELGLYCVG